MRKSRGLLGIEAAIILIAIVLVAAFLAYSVVNIGSTTVGKVKTTIGTGLTQASSSLQASGTILGLMCLEGGSGCGDHSSLGMVTYPIKLGAGGTPIDLDFSNTVVKYLSNSVEFDDIYNGTVDVETALVYVIDTNNNRVQIIDANSAFLNEFGSIGGGLGQFNSAFGIDVTKSGIIYVADRVNNRIQVFDSTGNNPFSFGSGGAGPGQFNNPFGIAYDSITGNVVVADTFNNRIEIFDSTGNFILEFGSAGAGPGQFSFPVRVATDGNSIYVADLINNRIQVFDFDGTFQFQFGSGGAGPGQFNFPIGIEAAKGKIFVSELNNDRVQVFDSSGNFLFQFGSLGGGNGQFTDPWEVDVDGSGNIYVADSGNNRIQIFNANGKFLSTFGSAGAGQGQFTFPAGLAIASYNGDPTSSVGVAAGRGIITTSLDTVYGPSASNTAAWIFFTSTSNANSVLEKGEHGVIGIAHAAQDRPNYSDKIRIELLTASGGTYTVTVTVPTRIQPITELG